MVPKLKDFYFCTKLCKKTNSRMQISNMTIVFSNSSPKIHKSGIFGPKYKLFFHKILQLDKFGVLISNMKILFSNSISKYPKKTFLVPKLGNFVFFYEVFFHDFCFRTKLCNKTNSRTQISNMTNSIFKFHFTKTQINHFWSQI